MNRTPLSQPTSRSDSSPVNGGAKGRLMTSQTSDLDTFEHETRARIAASADEPALEAVRVEALGKQGALSGLMRTLGQMSPQERATMGPRLNGLRDSIVEAIAVKRAALAEAALEARLKAEAVDVTLPATPAYRGAIHPISRVMEELARICGEMGFTLEEGPDIETDFNNFTALNFPEKHPARDMHDTFFFHPGPDGTRRLLRTHTSPVQVRTMLKQKPPIRMICQGRTYRCDSDATHTPMFHQMEGLVIDRTTNMADLKGTVTALVRAFFEVDELIVRFRPHFFPFTEPSAEMDVRCDRSGGQLKIGTGADWLEILGCGMVHPNVLRACGLDPEEWQGYAFGFGVDRMAMLKYAIPDLRDMFANDVRWLRHYGFSPYVLPGLAEGVG